MNDINVKIDTARVAENISVEALCKIPTVNNQPEYDAAAKLLSEIKARAKELDEQRKEITKPLDDAKAKVMDLYRAPLNLLKDAETKIKNLLIDYTRRVEEAAKAEQRRLEELARKEVEAEKKRIAAQIKRAEESGKLEKAEALMEKIEQVEAKPIPVIAPQISTPRGVSFRENWYAVVTDENLVPREYLMVNTAALDKIAKATKGSIKIAGVDFKMEKIVASR